MKGQPHMGYVKYAAYLDYNIEKAFHYFYRLRKSNIYSKHLRKVAHLNQPKSTWIQCLFYNGHSYVRIWLWLPFSIELCGFKLTSAQYDVASPHQKKNFTKDYPTSGYKTPSTVSLLAILNLLLAFEFLLVKLFTFQKPFSESISLDRIRVNYLQQYKRLKLWWNVFARNADIWFHIRDGETVSVDLVAWSDFAGEKSQHTHIFGWTADVQLAIKYMDIFDLKSCEVTQPMSQRHHISMRTVLKKLQWMDKLSRLT